MKNIIFSILFLSLFISCGPSAQEKAAMQQKHDDSLKMATENDVMQKLKAQQDSIARINSYQANSYFEVL